MRDPSESLTSTQTFPFPLWEKKNTCLQTTRAGTATQQKEGPQGFLLLDVPLKLPPTRGLYPHLVINTGHGRDAASNPPCTALQQSPLSDRDLQTHLTWFRVEIPFFVTSP